MAHKGGKNGKGRTRKEARRHGAAALAVERSARSPEQQLELLDARLGKGCGALKERARLLKQLSVPSREAETLTPTKKPRKTKTAKGDAE